MLKFKLIKRLCLLAIAATSLLFGSTPVHAERTLTIGDNAPSLDIEHWLSDRGGDLPEVTEFEDGKIYIVEFWATWCGPCIGSMPHLVELQNQYIDQGVQIISISNESLDEVKDLMGKDHPQAGVPFEKLTAAYSLTVDPDNSTYEAYMDASGARGIPNSYLVGKDGKIEWMGHPMAIDEVLDEVIAGTWDRDAFRKQYEEEAQMEENMTQLSQLAGTGKMDEAIEFASKLASEAGSEQSQNHWVNLTNNLKLMAGKVDDDTIAYYRNQFSDMDKKGDLRAMLSYGNMFFGINQEGGDLGPLGADLIKLLEKQENPAEKSTKMIYHNTLALLLEMEERFKEAYQSQKTAVEQATPRQARRMEPYLEELAEKAGIAPKDADEKKEPAAAAK